MEHKALIDELYFCAAQCAHCYDACEREPEKQKLNDCMMHDKDCEAICRLSAQALERDSDNAGLFTALCAKICERCADECEKHRHLEHCKKCADACRKCADACSNFEPVQTV